MAPIVFARTTAQYQKAGFEKNQVQRALYARNTINRYNREADIQDDAAHDSFGRPNFSQNYNRGLWFHLRRLLQSDEAIANAIDPTWQLLPFPEELQDSFGYMELVDICLY
ncbi:hypothetical protein ONS95_008587 [Cadophora gregata]|uniref:uncharacterized protein n=1 Tax=Cadophora gregata TaxID=51156 RepID=UPI0026DD1E05|nr:uncharacterized protein ONS95_008587 [Cadophora gregata]KAK0099836.1 hypothetical protein ONS95_008587 [Cadophora gregata]KAK0123601.1 hypothetical protein ONS96_010576 [Cadophora gregata f. sp. sojae]